MNRLPPHFASLRHPARIAVDQTIQLNARQVDALKLRQVNVSEAFTIQDAEGRYFRASLKGMGTRGAEALVYEEMARSPESPLDLTLVCAVLARQRMLLVIPKAVELGVTRIQPVLTAHSVKAEGLEHEKAHAWQNAAVRAMRQCRRASVPEVRPTVPLTEFLEDPLWQSAPRRLYLDDRAEEGAEPRRGPETVCLAVGPEGGWSEDERQLLEGAGAAPLLLGGRVLRAETAVITGTFLVQYLLGDLQHTPGQP